MAHLDEKLAKHRHLRKHGSLWRNRGRKIGKTDVEIDVKIEKGKQDETLVHLDETVE